MEAWVDPQAPSNYDGYVHVFNRDGTGHRKRAPKNILAMPDLYTIFEGEVRNLRIEEAFGQMEQAFVRIRQKLHAEEQIDGDDAANIYAFVGSMMARPPHRIEHFTKQFSSIVEKARSIRIDPTVPPIKSLDAARGMTIDEFQQLVDNPMGTWFPDEVAANIEVLTKMFGCDIFVNESEHPFLTSDAPAVIYRPPPNSKYRNMPRGLGSAGCEITFPVSPLYALLFRHKRPGVHNILRADWETVFMMNFRTLTHARKNFISDREDIYFVKTINDRITQFDSGKRA